MAKALTVKSIEAVKPGSSRQEIPDGGFSGLYLIVQPTGSMSWAVRYRADGRPKKLTIGSYPEIGLGDARDLARKAMVAIADGRDPAGEKRARREADDAQARREADSVASVLETFLDRYAKPKLRPNSYAEASRILRKDVAPRWKGKSIHDIRKRDIVELLDSIVDDGRPVLANRALAYVRRLMNWCVERDILDASPCAGIKPPTAETSRDRILSDSEVLLVRAATAAEGWPFGPFLDVLLLTAQRRDEVANMRWREVDLDKAVWTLPAARAKNGVAHVVPLAPSVVEILRALPRVVGKADFVFSTTGDTSISGFSRAKTKIDRAILAALQTAAREAGEDPEKVEPLARWVLHDLRRTAASGMARLGTSVAVVEKVLNHVSGQFAGVTGVYQRYAFDAEKRAALESWARYLDRLGTDDTADNVVRLRAAE